MAAKKTARRPGGGRKARPTKAQLKVRAQARTRRRANLEGFRADRAYIERNAGRLGLTRGAKNRAALERGLKQHAAAGRAVSGK